MRRTTVLLLPLLLGGAASPKTEILSGPDGGGWDYARVDPTTDRLYVARSTGVTVFDLSRRSAPRNIGAIDHGHAALPLDGSGDVLVTSGGDDSVRILDGGDGRELTRIAVGKDPDAAAIDERTGRAFVMNAKDGTVSALDVAKRAVVGTVQLKPGLEFAALDRRGLLYVNNEDANEIETVDTRTLTPGPAIALPGCEGPSGLAYDARNDRLLSACANGQAAVVDAGTKRETALLEIGRGPDAVLVDEARRRAYVPCGGSGELVVVSLDGRGGPTVARRVATEPLARTGALDPRDGTVYLPTARLGAPPPGSRRGAPIPGSFHVVVVRPPA